ncbi:MAG: glycosyltransferase [Myxococcota bacterium]
MSHDPQKAPETEPLAGAQGPRPRLLFLCQTLPYPPDGGVWIRSFHVLRRLSEAFDVTALCFERTGESGRRRENDAVESLRVLGAYARIEAFPIPQTHSRARLLWDHLRSVATRRVYTRYLYASTAFEQRLREVLDQQAFDLVHVDSLDLAGYLPLCDPLPTVCVHHNVESELLRRRSEFEAGRLGPYYRLQADLMEREERRWVPRLALNVMVSEDDRRVIERLAPGGRYCVVPNGVDVEEFAPGEGRDEGLAYVGGTNWFPNLDALDHFCEDIQPHLRAAGAEFPVHWVGSATAEQQAHYRERHGVELTGYVDDVRPYMRDSFCNIVPLRSGGGTRLKILNSWAMGKAVVSTSVGCEGLEARDGENILVRDDPRAFAEAILALSRDAALRRRLGAAARRTAEETYSWEGVGQAMNQRYLELIGRGADPR